MTALSIVAPFSLSFLLVTPFLLVLRGRWLAFAAGATVVAILAFLLETVAQDWIGLQNGPVVVLLIVAPAIEELLKLGISAATGRDYRSAAGVGAGFAASENGVYFLAAWGESTTSLVFLVVLRALTDPLIHITATTFTTASLRGREWGLLAGLGIHMSWNMVAYSLGYLPTGPGLLLLVVAALAVLGLLHYAYRNPAFRAELARRPGVFPWTGAAA